MRWVYDDGGRAAEGRRKGARDCVVRALAIATPMEYQVAYARVGSALRECSAALYGATPSQGVPRRLHHDLFPNLGWLWTPTMGIGTGCRVHLRDGELPLGRLIVQCSHHLVAVLDGVIHDTENPSREGTRCVYGYWRKQE